jgi:acyl-CoA synthetase (AMP-forming)/AMP-acid ligase II
MDLVRDSRITVLHGVPAMYNAIIAKDYLDSYDLSSLRIGMIGGDTYTVPQFMEIREKLHFTLVPGLGLTEGTGGITTARPDDDWRFSTTSAAFRWLEGALPFPRTRDEASRQGGRILVRGDCVMRLLHRSRVHRKCSIRTAAA